MEDNWDLFIDLDIELNDKDKNINKDKNKDNDKNINDNNYSYWNTLRIKRRFFYFYIVEKCNHQENETDFFKHKQIQEKNKYLDKFNCYKLQIKKV